MVKHKLTIKEAKALMAADPAQANRLMIYAIIFINIIAVCVMAFIYLVVR